MFGGVACTKCSEFGKDHPAESGASLAPEYWKIRCLKYDGAGCGTIRWISENPTNITPVWSGTMLVGAPPPSNGARRATDRAKSPVGPRMEIRRAPGSNTAIESFFIQPALRMR